MNAFFSFLLVFYHLSHCSCLVNEGYLDFTWHLWKECHRASACRHQNRELNIDHIARLSPCKPQATALTHPKDNEH
ncbi:hypothetical protein BKA63DRAFT_77334 [Paraphoma chrysanthemicola]|nr:hypothetical protein BKA63DRAFT_77334 [Paraphoma chrysanthemicola]